MNLPLASYRNKGPRLEESIRNKDSNFDDLSYQNFDLIKEAADTKFRKQQLQVRNRGVLCRSAAVKLNKLIDIE